MVSPQENWLSYNKIVQVIVVISWQIHRTLNKHKYELYNMVYFSNLAIYTIRLMIYSYVLSPMPFLYCTGNEIFV
jgi:hypothetical protein